MSALQLLSQCGGMLVSADLSPRYTGHVAGTERDQETVVWCIYTSILNCTCTAWSCETFFDPKSMTWICVI